MAGARSQLDPRNSGLFGGACRSILGGVFRSDLVPVLLFNALLLGVLLCAAIPFHLRSVTDNLAQCVGPFAAFIWSLCGRRRKDSSGPARWAPVFLGLGALGYALGQSIWTYDELALHLTTPFPSWADAGYLSAYPALFLGVLFLPTRPLPLAGRLRALFDSLMVMTALVTFSWYFVLGPTLMQSGESLISKAIGTAYPLADLVLLGSVLILTRRAGGGPLRSATVPLCLGFVSIILIDSVFDYETLHNTYVTGHWIDVGWPLGYMLVAVAARAARRIEVAAHPEPVRNASAPAAFPSTWESVKRGAGLYPSLLPYAVLPAVAGLVWHAAYTTGDEKFEGGVYAGAALLVLLLILRQFLTLLENQHLMHETEAFNVRLERTVAERTAQVEALLRLTAEVSGTLEVARVLAAAAEHTPWVMGADGMAVWLDAEVGAGLEIHGSYQSGLDGRPSAMHVFANAPAADGLTSCRDGEGGHYLLAPLRWRDQTLGWIGVARWERDFSIDDAELLHSVGLQVGTALENARQYRAARLAADRDPVTGLLNHRAIHQHLDAAVEDARRGGQPLAVIMADLDNFKLFNDTYGHPVGDQVLQKVAETLSEECCADVKIARYGGDEFLIAMPLGDGTEQAIALATRVRDRLARETFRRSDAERMIPLGMSFGVACFPQDCQNRHELLDTADANLYAAKESDERIVGLSEMQRTNRALRVDGSFRILDSMVTAVDNKDRYTRRHSEDVTVFALWIAEEIGLSEEAQRALRVGGLLHDVGKIGVPDDILRKPSRLTSEEYETLKQHAPLGALIVAGVPGMNGVIGAVRHHHERWDGKGYPDALAGLDIPLDARILAVADAMSAMTTDRPYRKGLSWETAMREVSRVSGTQLDPNLAAAFLRAAKVRRGEQKAPDAAPTLRAA